MTRQIRRHLATTWTRYTPRETAWPATPASVTLPQPVPCLASNAAHRRSSLPSACCCRFEIEISPSRSIPDTHVSLLLFSLSLSFFLPSLFPFLSSFFLTLSTRYWILGGGRICGFLLAVILDYSQSRPLLSPRPLFFPI